MHQIRADEFNSFESQLSRFWEAIHQLEQLGVKIADGCRLRSYGRRLEQMITDPRPAVESKLVFASAFDLREIDEIIEIVNHLPDHSDAPTLDLLRKLAGGSEHPDDEGSTPAREAQYELYLGTVLRRAGIPARHGSPDLVASWRQEDFFIEAKRPSSPKRLDDRLRSAVHQVRKLRKPGIIAISADQLLRPSGGLLAVDTIDDLAPVVDRLLVKFMLQNSQALRKRLEKEPVAAVLWTARIPARMASTGHVALGSALRLEIIVDGTPEASFASAVLDAYLNAQKAP